jgi:hypothetical protein
MTNNLSDISVRGLKKAIKIKTKLETLQGLLNDILGASGVDLSDSTPKRRMSAAGRRRIAAAQRARWAKVKGKKPGSKGKRRMSATARARISAAAKRRWKAAKAAGKSKL